MKPLSVLIIVALFTVGCSSIDAEVDRRVAATVSAFSAQWTLSAQTAPLATATPVPTYAPIFIEITSTPQATVLAITTPKRPG